MLHLILGAFSFLMFLCYDLNNITARSFAGKALFPLAALLLLYATIQAAILPSDGFLPPVFLRILFWALAAVFLLLLAYTLLIVMVLPVPADPTRPPAVYDRGVYALCRHPGVLWFAGAYFSAWLAMGKNSLLAAAFLFSLLNLLYVVIQDRFIFPRQFPEYPAYQASVPFLIPNFESVKRCLETLKASEEF